VRQETTACIGNQRPAPARPHGRENPADALRFARPRCARKQYVLRLQVRRNFNSRDLHSQALVLLSRRQPSGGFNLDTANYSAVASTISTVAEDLSQQPYQQESDQENNN
jgi:hypothetical protein